MKATYRVTITIDDGAPTGTALLYALTDLIKDVAYLVDLKPGQRHTVDFDVDCRLSEGQNRATVSRL